MIKKFECKMTQTQIIALGFLLVATVLNIILDVWFVAGFDMGVAGVALATVIAQGVSAILCFIKLLHMRDVFDLTFGTLKLRRDITKRVIDLGVPSGLTQGLMSVAMLVVQSLTNSLGEIVIACSVIVMRVDGFAMMPNMSFGQAMSVYTGQNVGAKKMDRVDAGIKQGGLMAMAVSATITGVLLLFGHVLFAFFTDTPELVDLAVRMMRILAVGYICVSVTQVLGGVMRGCGDTVTPMWITMLSSIGMRVPMAYLLTYLTRCPEYPNGTPAALFTSLLISWSTGAILSVIVFRRGKWREKAMNAID